MEEQVQQKSWFSRNWMWAVPGCGCLGVILLFVFGIGATIFGVTNLFENSSPYNHAVEQAQNNSQVIEILGEPIETNGMMNGSISFNDEGGNADFTVLLKGPNGKATLIVNAERFDGVWVYEDLYVEIKETQERINLLDQTLEGI